MKFQVLTLWLGFGLYMANLMLGVGVQYHILSTRRFHWVHHALYFVVFLAAGLATLVGILLGSRWWPLVLTLLCLGALPRFRGGSSPHRNLALLGLVGYLIAVA